MSPRKTLIKTVVYRLGSMCMGFVVNLILLKDPLLAFNVSWILFLAFSTYYYLFERFWNRFVEKRDA